MPSGMISSGKRFPNSLIESAPTNSTNPPDAASILSALAAMAKTAPPAAPPATASAPPPHVGSFANSTNSADPRMRNAFSPPQSIATPALPSQPAPPAANPLAALAALLPQAQPYDPILTLILIADNPLHLRSTPKSLQSFNFSFNRASH